MVALALIGIAITEFVVPTPRRVSVHRDAEAVPALIGSVLWNGELLRLDVGIFALHAMLTASFLVVPGLLRGTLDIATHNDWMIYLPVLLISIAVMVPAIIVAEKYRRMKGVFVAAVVALLVSQVMLYFGAHNLYVLLAALTLFFSGFNVMEASLPSLITKVAPPDAKGTAMGLYSSLQFLGIFVGGVVGGWANQNGRHRRGFCIDRGAHAALAAGGGHHEATELSDDAAGADRRWPGRRRRGSRRALAPGAGRGRGRGDRRGKARLSQGGFETLRLRHGACAGRRAVSTFFPSPRFTGRGWRAPDGASRVRGIARPLTEPRSASPPLGPPLPALRGEGQRVRLALMHSPIEFSNSLSQRSAARILCGAGYAVVFLLPPPSCEGTERRAAHPSVSTPCGASALWRRAPVVRRSIAASYGAGPRFPATVSPRRRHSGAAPFGQPRHRTSGRPSGPAVSELLAARGHSARGRRSSLRFMTPHEASLVSEGVGILS